MSILAALGIGVCYTLVQVSIRDRRGRNVMDYAVEGSSARRALEEHLRQLESKASQLQVRCAVFHHDKMYLCKVAGGVKREEIVLEIAAVSGKYHLLMDGRRTMAKCRVSCWVVV